MRKGSGNCVFSEPLYDAHAVFPVPNETFKTELTELGELGARRRGFFIPSLYALGMCVLSNMASTHYRHIGRFLNRLRLCRGYNTNVAVSMILNFPGKVKLIF